MITDLIRLANALDSVGLSDLAKDVRARRWPAPFPNRGNPDTSFVIDLLRAKARECTNPDQRRKIARLRLEWMDGWFDSPEG